MKGDYIEEETIQKLEREPTKRDYSILYKEGTTQR